MKEKQSRRSGDKEYIFQRRERRMEVPKDRREYVQTKVRVEDSTIQENLWLC